jgi:hypothetical protein
MVGDTGFEPAASRTPSVRASQLRQSPPSLSFGGQARQIKLGSILSNILIKKAQLNLKKN